MYCFNCGSDGLYEEVVENYEFLECGLRNIYLPSVTIHKCRNCNEEELSIPNLENIHNTIASTLSLKQSLLPEEIEFLRKHNIDKHMQLNTETLDLDELLDQCKEDYHKASKKRGW